MLEEKIALAARDSSAPIIVAIYETPAERRELGLHSHARGQLSGLSRGLATMGTEAGAWIIPADLAVWIPPHLGHFGYTHGATEAWNCYIAESACANLPDHTCAVKASGLLREAIIRASEWQGQEMDEGQRRARLMRALELLAENVPVTTVALDLGYDSISAFIALFKRAFGVTPSAYFTVV